MIERIGIERSKKEIDIADLVVMVIDERCLEDEDFEIAQHIEGKTGASCYKQRGPWY